MKRGGFVLLAALGLLGTAAYLMTRRASHWDFDDDWWE